MTAQTRAEPRGRTVHTAARRLTDERPFEWLARFGFVTRGVVYGVIGILALEVALGAGGKTASQRGALVTIARQPFGNVLMIVVCAGLAGYSVWRLASAVVGRRERREHGALQRLIALVSGLAYAAVCVTAFRVLAGGRTTGGINNPKQATAGVLGWPGGAAIVAVVGAVLVGVGAVQAYRGVRREFLKECDTATMSPGTERGFSALGVAGHLARAVVFGLIGYGLIKAAADYSPRNAIGLDGALAKLARASYGPALLGIVAAGLIAFALFSLIEARYRKI